MVVDSIEIRQRAAWQRMMASLKDHGLADQVAIVLVAWHSRNADEVIKVSLAQLRPVTEDIQLRVAAALPGIRVTYQRAREQYLR